MPKVMNCGYDRSSFQSKMNLKNTMSTTFYNLEGSGGTPCHTHPGSSLLIQQVNVSITEYLFDFNIHIVNTLLSWFTYRYKQESKRRLVIQLQFHVSIF